MEAAKRVTADLFQRLGVSGACIFPFLGVYCKLQRGILILPL